MEPKYKIGQTVLYHTDYNNNQYEFTIKRIEHLQAEDPKLESIVYYDCEQDESSGFIYEEDIDGLSPNYINITKDNLEENGWKHTFHKCGGDRTITIDMWEKDFEINDRLFLCQLENSSNTVGRDWTIYINNSWCESLASLDVKTYGQIDKLLQLLVD